MVELKRLLVLAPHPDDGEFGAGGSIHRWVQEGVEVHYVAFSPCIKSLPPDSPDDLLHDELLEATARLGIAADRVHLLDFPVREFSFHRQAILEKLIAIRKTISPDTVLVPCSTDIHQDHQVINQEGVRAFKHSNILGYELPWNNIHVTTNFHVRLEQEHVQAKLEALHCYKSQHGRDYLSDEFIFGLAKVRGLQVAHPLAESFELIRAIH